ncbi:MAG: hypothetical protein EKK63_02530 [Acinetobacter sp.]|uniref:hypothetical protein n=1 Tax=Acinetobacter sp. TaxID=472 RepID=UPI000FA9579E|nr:hypothetical protein [Acinetobacter sp.]RUP42193.1 MAG: hypothetical protein EKK63_02530 [Acinetobacter sp.]
MAIGINLGDDDDLTSYGVTPGPFAHWAEDFGEDDPEEDFSLLEAFEDKYPLEPTKELWWGYKHTSGTYQAKRYFGPLDTDEARDSPFCEQVVGPFPAKDRDEALDIVKQLTTCKP